MRWFLAFTVLGIGVGCGESTDTDDEFQFGPNTAIRAHVAPKQPSQELPGAIEPRESRRFGYDHRNRLIAAESLVGGFEVPLGLFPRGHNDGFIEFESAASGRALREFYRGVDRQMRTRFSPRKYILTDTDKGFEVRHTAASLKRLKLADKYAKAYIYIYPTVARKHAVRIHEPPPDKPKAHAGRFRNEPAGVARPARMVLPPSAPATSKQPRAVRQPTSPRVKPVANGISSGTAALGQLGQGGSTANTPSAQPIPVVTGQSAATSRAASHWKHPPSAERSVAPEIQRWKAENPGKPFLD